MTTALDPADIAATVRTATASYPIVVADGSLARVGAICRETGLRGRAFLLTDASVGPLYAAATAAALAAAGYPVETLAIPPGEEHKHLGTVSTVYDWLIGHRVERQDFVVCLGGGVVTDLGGFAAATCLRGIDFVHVPTSMLAMVDAAVGGKTGVDHPRGKNLVGAFAQPRAVVIDPLVLETLPERQLRAGWAEVVKHGLILDAELFADLEARAGDSSSMRDARLIGRSVAIKAEVVSGDEREAGQRTLLNYGHTFGHAIEALTGYNTYLHGEAVAIGMRAAGLMALETGRLAPEAFERQQALIRACGLPEHAPGLDPDLLIDATRVDKKVRDGTVTWVVLEAIGRATTTRALSPETVARAARAITSA